MTQQERYATLSSDTLRTIRRVSQQVLAKRTTGDAQKMTHRRIIADIDAVLKARGETP